MREGVLLRDSYLCCRCGQPASEVHHIIHLSPENLAIPAIAYDASNLESLCHECHMKTHAEDEFMGEYTFDENGFVIPKRAGPPV